MSIHKLTPKKIDGLKPGQHGDGGGLWIVVAATGSKRWVYRYMIAGKASAIGLGGYPSVSLAEARDKAGRARDAVKAGKNPAASREGEEAKPSFGQVADDLIASKGQSWRNDKHRAQWVMTLTNYCEPIRSKPVDEVTTADVLEILTPLWQKVPETASRLRGRIEAVLNAAKAKGHRSGENPASWRGHLDHLLPRRQKLSRGHHAAMPYKDVPAFMAALAERDGFAGSALRFTILTAARSGETLGARWDEIDIDARIWTVPAVRMKAGVEHRVPLSDAAMAVLESLPRASDYIFPGVRSHKPLSNMAMEMLLRRMNADDYTVHGMRSTFRDWAGNETSFPREVCEAALAHTLQGVEAAYRRGDALEKRRSLMQAWGLFCERAGAENVVSLAARR